MAGFVADNVARTSVEYDKMAENWVLLHDLLGGTATMQAAGERWLPREPAEEQKAWDIRLLRTVLYNAYKDTVKKLVSKPYSRQVTVDGSIDLRLEAMQADMDLAGSDITQFGRDLLKAAVIYGLTHVLVDYPRATGKESKAEEIDSGARPYCIHIEPPNLLAWTSVAMPNGEQRLTSIRFKEVAIEQDGDYGTQEVEYIRVWTETYWEKWRRTSETTDEWEKIDEGNHTFNGIPLVTFYTNRTGFLTGEPPLYELAEMNLVHWQSFSDQRNILRFSRLALLFGSGFDQQQMEDGLVVSVNNVIWSRNKEAKLVYVEHTGAAIGAGQVDLDKLEERMEILGLQPLVQRTGDATATGATINETRTHTDIQAWIASENIMVRRLFVVAGEWIRVTVGDGFKISIFDDFGISLRQAQDVSELTKIWQGGGITHNTFLIELKKRGVLDESIDVEAEVEAVKDEMPVMPMLTPEPDEEEDIELELEEAAVNG